MRKCKWLAQKKYFGTSRDNSSQIFLSLGHSSGSRHGLQLSLIYGEHGNLFTRDITRQAIECIPSLFKHLPAGATV